MLEIGKVNRTILMVTDELLKSGRVDEQFVNRFYSSFEQPTVQIGVVGKMKAGKSALINAVIFGGDVLPSSEEPTTVTLTKISYGESNISTVEFLSETDIEAIRRVVSYDGEDENQITQKENAENILESFPENYKEFVGKTIENIPNDDLPIYVAADGKYCSLVKSVSMQINNIDIKGITIIDTPGFNDPVISRGETTKQFLTECHVVLFVHNSDGYDETDAALLANQIEYAGISCLIDVFNKMDTRKKLLISEWNNKVEDFKEDRNEYFSEENHPKSYSLIKDSEAIPVSAYMALCGMKQKDIRSDFDNKKIAEWEVRYPELTEDDNEILEEKLIRYSNIGKIINQFNKLSSEGKKYLLDKPINTLVGKLASIIEQIESDIKVAESNLALYNQDRDSAQSDIDGVLDFMNSVKESILASPLKVKLMEEIASSRKQIQSLRETESNAFSKEAYNEPSAFSSGITKANISAYNTFLSRFQSILRNEFNNLSNQLESTNNQYVRNIILSLGRSVKISEARRDNFEESAKNKAKSLLQGVNIVIDAYSISSLPYGASEQWSLFKSDFLAKYDDIFIDKYLSDFRSVADYVGNPSFLLDIVSKMEEDILAVLNASPAKINELITAEKSKLQQYELELSWAKKQIEILNQL